jgi:hypothetical protein
MQVGNGVNSGRVLRPGHPLVDEGHGLEAVLALFEYGVRVRVSAGFGV